MLDRAVGLTKSGILYQAQGRHEPIGLSVSRETRDHIKHSIMRCISVFVKLFRRMLTTRA